MVRLNRTQNCTGILNLSFKIRYGLTVHIICFKKKKKFLQAKFSIFQNCPIKSNSSELRKFRTVRTTQSANYAKFAHFVNLFYIMFQAPAPAENPGKFQRITQIPHDSPTQPTNHANSAHFAL